MKSLINFFDTKFYSSYSGNWDDDLFRKNILDKLDNEMIMLDIGAGAGIIKAMNFRGLSKKVIGLDPDPRVTQNPYLDEGYEGFGENLPFDNEIFDIVIMDNVAEHLANPLKVFEEINRVLKPGGILLFKTPNIYHYMPLISIITPTSFHKFINKIRGRESEDTFPTQYKVNSEKQICEIANKTNFVKTKIEYIEGRPEYLRISTFLYVFGIFYERIVNSSNFFKKIRILLICEMMKPLE